MNKRLSQWNIESFCHTPLNAFCFTFLFHHFLSPFIYCFLCFTFLTLIKQDKYGNGYTLSLILQSSHYISVVKEYIENYISGAKLKYRGHRSLVFDLKILCSELADVYKIMEDMPGHLDVADYSLNQNTLDNVSVYCCLKIHAMMHWLDLKFCMLAWFNELLLIDNWNVFAVYIYTCQRF